MLLLVLDDEEIYVYVCVCWYVYWKGHVHVGGCHVFSMHLAYYRMIFRLKSIRLCTLNEYV